MSHCCEGMMGMLFGHNFEEVFDVEHGEPKFTPSSANVSDSLSYNLCKFVPLIEASKSDKSRYVHSVCRRCGQIVQRPGMLTNSLLESPKP